MILDKSFSASTCLYVWYIRKWFQEAFVSGVQEVINGVVNSVKFGYCEGKIWEEWLKLHFTASGTTRYVSKGKHDAKELLLGEEDIVSDGYEVSENTWMP